MLAVETVELSPALKQSDVCKLGCKHAAIKSVEVADRDCSVHRDDSAAERQLQERARTRCVSWR